MEGSVRRLCGDNSWVRIKTPRLTPVKVTIPRPSCQQPEQIPFIPNGHQAMGEKKNVP